MASRRDAALGTSVEGTTRTLAAVKREGKEQVGLEWIFFLPFLWQTRKEDKRREPRSGDPRTGVPEKPG